MGKKTRFCVRCGKETSALVEGACIDCKSMDIEVKVPKSMVLNKCRYCGAVSFEGLWIKAEQPDEFYFENMLIKKVKLPENAELQEIKINKLMNGFGNITVNYTSSDHLFSRTFDITYDIRKIPCDFCQMKKRQHYEAMIQVRTPDLAERAKILKLVEPYSAHLLKIDETPTGPDIFFFSKEAARQLAAELRMKFKLKTKETGQAYSWDSLKNRPKYKLTIAMRKREDE
ncbi:MAG: NMD3-related protein [Nanoarchaeota archaeon]|mgnify:FL=1